MITTQLRQHIHWLKRAIKNRVVGTGIEDLCCQAHLQCFRTEGYFLSSRRGLWLGSLYIPIRPRMETKFPRSLVLLVWRVSELHFYEAFAALTSTAERFSMDFFLEQMEMESGGLSGRDVISSLCRWVLLTLVEMHWMSREYWDNGGRRWLRDLYQIRSIFSQSLNPMCANGWPFRYFNIVTTSGFSLGMCKRAIDRPSASPTFTEPCD